MDEELVIELDQGPVVPGKPLYQLHQIHPDGRREWVAQTDLDSYDGDLKAWQNHIFSKYPLPESAYWEVCNDKSSYFFMAACEGKGK